MLIAIVDDIAEERILLRTRLENILDQKNVKFHRYEYDCANLHDNTLWIIYFKRGDFDADFNFPDFGIYSFVSGMLLAYLPVRSSLKQTPKKLAVWMLPLLIICSCFCGFACYRFHLSTRSVFLPLLFVLLVLYHNTLLISLWKSVSIYLAVCAVFSCFNSLSRAASAMLNFGSGHLAFSLVFLLLESCIIFSAFFSSFSYGIQPPIQSKK